MQKIIFDLLIQKNHNDVMQLYFIDKKLIFSLLFLGEKYKQNFKKLIVAQSLFILLDFS